MVVLIPIINLNDRTTFGVLDAVPVNFIVVRLQDLVSKKTFEFNKTFNDVMAAGGLHNFLHYSGPIVLSLIMKDEIIKNFNPQKYAIAINSLRPNSYTTVDGETYSREHSISMTEINRIHKENIELIRLCPRHLPIGLVKGCTDNQLELHIEYLKSLGIKDFIFHVGDFLRHGDDSMINKARGFCSRIRGHARYLMLYGMGSQKRLLQLSFADAYISFNHFVTAINGMKFIGTNKVKYSGGYNNNIMIENFMEMHKNVSLLSEQKKLFDGGENKWVGELEAVAKVMQDHRPRSRI